MKTIKEIEATKEAQKFLQYFLDEFKIELLNIKVKNTLRGRAIYKTRSINIPLWAYNAGIDYFYYYCIHEFCHFVIDGGHTKRFLDFEKSILHTLGYIPIYKKVYIKELKSVNGDTLYKRSA